MNTCNKTVSHITYLLIKTNEPKDTNKIFEYALLTVNCFSWKHIEIRSQCKISHWLTSLLVFLIKLGWICYYRVDGLCLCVYLCVSSLQPKQMRWFWWNFSQMIWKVFARFIFSRISTLQILGRHGNHFVLFLIWHFLGCNVTSIIFSKSCTS